MIAGGGYFDGSHDHILMEGSMIHDSSQSSIYDNTDVEQQNFRFAPFIIEDHSNPANLTSEAARVIDQIQHQLGIDIEQDHSDHMMQEVPPAETENLVPAVYGVQDHILSHQIEGPHNITVEQQVLGYDPASYRNGTYAAAHDLLNSLHIQRCSLIPEFPSTEHIFSDPAQNMVNRLDITNDLPGVANHESGMMFSDSTVPLGYHATQSHMLKDLYHSLPQNYGLFTSDDERDGMVGVPGVSGNIFQEIDGRQFDSPILGSRKQKGGFGKGKGKANFATERERREQFNVKYGALRSLFPNPTKNDRASIVGDAIEYINELNRTVKELKILLEKKRNSADRRKILKLDEEAADDGESSSMQPVSDDQNNQMNGTIRSSWVQRRSKECDVDVRIVDDEINIKFTEKKRANSLLCAAKVLEEFHLELIHVVGGIIGDHHIFMFNTKIPKGSSVYACAVAKKLLEAVEIKKQAYNIFN
ncbi:Transcription factor EAT1 [Zea mays]|uniref:Helix-loop-helix DNA-binding domain containing protein n=2 Tax=Zea mays TaxID=4577 RepID=A0A1D6HH16_MAIZE|nr:Transcription factor EAT1 [Zea mays]AQK73852.1 Helix-loop-helix DNA-binding domain containing protein [Zea mays]PWZ23442.1 Transcription factor EAT1 [Zea mays]|eukprot:NP_001149299.2 helix-loop-helix DNA-binding domain containing protein [Zea mays]